MANFYLYTDESGKLGKSEYTSFCGFVAHQTEWWRFFQEWDNCRDSWGVPAIHMSHIMYPERDRSGRWSEVRTRWGDIWERRRTDMLDEFAGLVLRSHLVCVGTVVDAEYFLAMPEHNFKRTMKDPLYLAFYNVVRNALDNLDRVHPSRTDSLAIVVDDDQEYSLSCYKLLNWMRTQFPDEIGKRIDQMSFGNDTGYPGLQVADMIAYESRARMIEKKRDPKSEPGRLYGALTRNGLWQPTLYTPEYLDMANTDTPNDES